MSDSKLTEKEITAALIREKPIAEAIGFQWFEVGLISAEAQAKKLFQWLHEPCHKHDTGMLRLGCPECWKELRKGVGL